MEEDRFRSARKVLERAFGYDTFRPGQQQAICALLEGSDVVAVMPTGAGKSVCYQIPAVVMPGLALVISPLISLMADQVRSLQEIGIRSACLNSALTSSEQLDILTLAHKGFYDLIYVAPERLADSRFRMFVQEANISLIAIDEAHCVSQWGQDFRPSYLQISDFVRSLPVRPRMIALTATATERVRDDIVRLLGLSNPVSVVTGFDRPNLYFAVDRQEAKHKLQWLDRFIDDHSSESGIVYCSKRETVEEVCAHLQERGFSATRYHAGLSATERADNQNRFVKDIDPIMVATNAFGMGIDKSNVRYVVHFNMPGSIEAYYQEAGRAGRDGEAAECVLLWCNGDIATARFFIERDSANNVLTPAEIESVRAGRRRMLEAMIGYCYTTECLRHYLLNYFGEEDTPSTRSGFRETQNCSIRCCSNCEDESKVTDVTDEARLVMRCVQVLGGRFGKTTIVDILRGSNSEKMNRYRFTELPVYGSSTARSAVLKEVVELLAAGSYLSISEGKYPLVSLGDRWHEIERSGFRLTMKSVSGSSKKHSEASKTFKRASKKDLEKTDEELFERLRLLRLRLAREADVPPYVIFHDSTLAAMAVARPTSREEFLALPGVGEQKLSNYGDIFLKEIAASAIDERSGSVRHSNERSPSSAKEEADLFEALRKLRMRIAKEEHLPAYMIFHDKTLREIAKKRPQTIDELMEVPGVGKVKAAKYGEFIIDEIKKHDD